MNLWAGMETQIGKTDMWTWRGEGGVGRIGRFGWRYTHTHTYTHIYITMCKIDS